MLHQNPDYTSSHTVSTVNIPIVLRADHLDIIPPRAESIGRICKPLGEAAVLTPDIVGLYRAQDDAAYLARRQKAVQYGGTPDEDPYLSDENVLLEQPADVVTSYQHSHAQARSTSAPRIDLAVASPTFGQQLPLQQQAMVEHPRMLQGYASYGPTGTPE